MLNTTAIISRIKAKLLRAKQSYLFSSVCHCTHYCVQVTLVLCQMVNNNIGHRLPFGTNPPLSVSLLIRVWACAVHVDLIIKREEALPDGAADFVGGQEQKKI